MQEIKRAEENMHNAQKALVSAVEKKFPVGSILYAVMGRSTVRGRVLGYGAFYHSAGYITVENTRTGKIRRFYAPLDCHNVYGGAGL